MNTWNDGTCCWDCRCILTPDNKAKRILYCIPCNKKKRKVYRDKVRLIKYTCECGRHYTEDTKTRHQRTYIHYKALLLKQKLDEKADRP